MSDYTVILFSPDATRWTVETRYVRAARPDHTGAFRVPGMPPGNYLLAAVEYVERGQWLDPQYLESLRSRAQKVRLDAGTKTDVQLSILSEPR